MPLGDLSKLINEKLFGSFTTMRLVASEIIATNAMDNGELGVIISTASVAAYEGQIGNAHHR